MQHPGLPVGARRERPVDVAQVGPYSGVVRPEPDRLIQAGEGLRVPSRGPVGEGPADRERRRGALGRLEAVEHAGGLLPLPGAQMQHPLQEAHGVGAAQTREPEGVEQHLGPLVVARVKRGHHVVHARRRCLGGRAAGEGPHQQGQHGAERARH